MQVLENVLKACADKNRIRILKLLEKKNLCVCEISFVLGITQPSVSRHLKKLKKAGIIEAEQDSFWTNYKLKSKNLCASNILFLMRKWLKNDNVIKKDIAKLKKANRVKLCCTK